MEISPVNNTLCFGQMLGEYWSGYSMLYGPIMMVTVFIIYNNIMYNDKIQHL